MKIAVLGTGFMGRKHKANIQTVPDAEIVAEIDAVDRNAHFRSLEDFLNVKKYCDLVIVATPNHLHFPHALKLLENGYNVLVEKPFCFNLKEADILEEASRKSGKKVFLVIQNRFSPASVFLKNLIDSQKLGRLYNLQFNAFWNRGRNYYSGDSWKGKKSLDGGILYTQFSHLLDLLCHIFDEELNVKYRDFESFRNFEIAEIEDTAIAILESTSGTRILLDFTTAVFEKNQETSLNIIAEKGTIKISGQYFNEVTYQNIEGCTDRLEIPSASNEDNLKRMYKQIFLNLEQKPNQAVLLEQGRPLIALLEKIYS